MRSVILGTAGHIDHGKTALVRALTGVETDRLKEEKERGITIDLGFAELPGEGVRLGVVDVPGHEGFVRNMLAGATGMDVVLLVVAADEGVMPQTREHLAILSLLGVARLVVAITKVDLVEDEWVDLVEDEVRDTLGPWGLGEAPFARVSSRTGQGIDALRALLLRTAAETPPSPDDDLFMLPVDRVFTVRGTGTVVTGTLVSGTVRVGDRVRLLPTGLAARVRGVQVHGADVAEARAGARTAVALTGDGIERDTVARGETLVTDPAWGATHMLTVEFDVLADTGWGLGHNQRVRVHLGTAEVMARCVVFGDDDLPPGGRGWGQLRLEAPVVARGGQRGVLRSFSPVTTIAGFRVIEPLAPKRGRRSGPVATELGRALDESDVEAIAAVVAAAGPGGVSGDQLPIHTGRSPSRVAAATTHLEADGAGSTAAGRWLSPAVVTHVAATLAAEVDRVHESEPFRPGVPVERLRSLVPEGAAPGLGDLVLGRLVDSGDLRVARGVVARVGFEPHLSVGQHALRADLVERFEAAGLAPPFLAELPETLRDDAAFGVLVAALVEEGVLVLLDHELYVSATALAAGVGEVRKQLGERRDLGPADFRDALPVTRRHLLPILTWCDENGVTRRDGDRRSVVPEAGTGEQPGNPPR